MNRLNIGVCASTFKLLFGYSAPMAEVVSVITQHNIVVSPNIIAYFLSKCTNETDRQRALSLLGNVINGSHTNGFKFVNSDKGQNNNSIDDVYSHRKDFSYNTLIAFDEEVISSQGNKIKKYISPTQIMDGDDNYTESPLFKYTFPITAYRIKKSTNGESVRSWFRNLLRDEQHVIIVDPYLFTKKEIQAFSDIYLQDIISFKSSEIDLYGSIEKSDTTEENVKKAFSKIDFGGRRVKIYNHYKPHPRWISTEHLTITLDASLEYTIGETLNNSFTVSVNAKDPLRVPEHQTDLLLEL